ncbi:hypothetical protein HK096_004252 [Nowakowskiella sp. JEL0078]|nr:hypothetical protein HK096_004252 [Nowakowskiella sp. JEL0078]
MSLRQFKKEFYSNLLKPDPAIAVPRYVAISHVWGLVVNNVPEHDVDKQTFIANYKRDNDILVWYDVNEINANGIEDHEKKLIYTSMYELYANAELVIILLTDDDSDRIRTLARAFSENDKVKMVECTASLVVRPLEYLSRLWTLQELYAAKNLRAFARYNYSYLDIREALLYASIAMYEAGQNDNDEAPAIYTDSITGAVASTTELAPLMAEFQVMAGVSESRYKLIEREYVFASILRRDCTMPEDRIYATYRLLCPKLQYEYGVDPKQIYEDVVTLLTSKDSVQHLATYTHSIPIRSMGCFEPQRFIPGVDITEAIIESPPTCGYGSWLPLGATLTDQGLHAVVNVYGLARRIKCGLNWIQIILLLGLHQLKTAFSRPPPMNMRHVQTISTVFLAALFVTDSSLKDGNGIHQFRKMIKIYLKNTTRETIDSLACDSEKTLLFLHQCADPFVLYGAGCNDDVKRMLFLRKPWGVLFTSLPTPFCGNQNRPHDIYLSGTWDSGLLAIVPVGVPCINHPNSPNHTPDCDPNKNFDENPSEGLFARLGSSDVLADTLGNHIFCRIRLVSTLGNEFTYDRWLFRTDVKTITLNGNY